MRFSSFFLFMLLLVCGMSLFMNSPSLSAFSHSHVRISVDVDDSPPPPSPSHQSFGASAESQAIPSNSHKPHSVHSTHPVHTPSHPSTTPACHPSPLKFSVKQFTAMQQLTSCFENSTPVIQYGYCKALGDGRGITAGRSGFTTRDGDLLDVVKRLGKLLGPLENPFSSVVSALQHAATHLSPSLNNLFSLCTLWESVLSGPHREMFIKAQNDAYLEEHLLPGYKMAKELGLTTALSFGEIVDTYIQNGDGDDGDSVGELIAKTNESMSMGHKQHNGIYSENHPMPCDVEKAWMATFFKVRLEDLKNPVAKDSQAEWSESVDRVHAMERIAQRGQSGWDLQTPFSVIVFDEPCHVSGEMEKAVVPKDIQ